MVSCSNAQAAEVGAGFVLIVPPVAEDTVVEPGNGSLSLSSHHGYWDGIFSAVLLLNVQPQPVMCGFAENHGTQGSPLQLGV